MLFRKWLNILNKKKKEIIIKKIISSQALKKRDGFSKHVINFIEKIGFNAATGQMKNDNVSNNQFSNNNMNLMINNNPLSQ